MKLYELTNELSEFAQAVENGEIPEEAITDTLDSIQGEIESKAESVALLIKNWNADLTELKAERDNFNERIKAKQGEIDRLSAYLDCQLKTAGIDKIETARAQIKFTKSKAVEIADDEAFCKKYPLYATIEIKYKPSKTDIKKAIAGGMQFEGAELVERKNLKIK